MRRKRRIEFQDDVLLLSSIICGFLVNVMVFAVPLHFWDNSIWLLFCITWVFPALVWANAKKVRNLEKLSYALNALPYIIMLIRFIFKRPDLFLLI